MARMTKREKQIEAAVTHAFNKHGTNVQFDIMDLGKISAAGKAAAGNDPKTIDTTAIEQAVEAACHKYAKN